MQVTLKLKPIWIQQEIVTLLWINWKSAAVWRHYPCQCSPHSPHTCQCHRLMILGNRYQSIMQNILNILYKIYFTYHVNFSLLSLNSYWLSMVRNAKIFRIRFYYWISSSDVEFVTNVLSGICVIFLGSGKIFKNQEKLPSVICQAELL